MKILFAGGGTGGHFYPLIAIAEDVNALIDEQRITGCKLYYMSDKVYDKKALDEHFITFIPITAGKMRVYFSVRNFIDLFKTGFGILGAIIKVFRLYPDVVISKGGYASFPTLVAAKLLRIPVIMHESDTVPGRVNLWTGKFATKIALSYPEAAQYFDARKVSVTGQPVRNAVAHAAADKAGAASFFEFDPNLPTIGILGGSQGAERINTTITALLPKLLEKYQVIHQCGKGQYEEVKSDAEVIAGKTPHYARYKLYPFLGDLESKMLASMSDLIVTRAGSTLFEVAAWGKPSVVIPYPIAHGDHQRKNAYHYARTGACTVIEESNLTDSVLMSEIDRLLDPNDDSHRKVMAEHAAHFYTPDAGRKIATEALSIALSHENQ